MVPDKENLLHLFENLSSEFISCSWENTKSKLYFKCSCGEKSYTIVQKFRKDPINSTKCLFCKGARRLRISTIQKDFEDVGAELISKDYKNIRSKIYFKCSSCSKEHYTTIEQFYDKKCNPHLLCSDCLKGNTLKPLNDYGNGISGGHRHLIDTFWFGLVKRFFNISKPDDYSSHHIKPYSSYPDLRTSLFNGFPILKEFHKNSFVELSTGIRNPLHMRKEYLNPENWQDYLFLESYPKDFKLCDLSNYIISEVIPLGTDKNVLYDKKLFYHEKGILYIPLYFEELYREDKVEIIFSMLRNRAYKFYPQVYLYTQQELKKFSTRKCIVKEIDAKTAKDFFNFTHIQGFVGSVIYIGLYFEEILVAAMSFSNIRNKFDNDKTHYELTRYSTALNSSVPGGAQKLFKYFIQNYNPNLVVSYCDIRFSSANPYETVYPKLGFKFEGYSKPNYKYLHLDSNRLYSRQIFQKHKLSSKLENFDESLSEMENMYNNGYIPVYDCGNFRFIWRKD